MKETLGYKPHLPFHLNLQKCCLEIIHTYSLSVPSPINTQNCMSYNTVYTTQYIYIHSCTVYSTDELVHHSSSRRTVHVRIRATKSFTRKQIRNLNSYQHNLFTTLSHFRTCNFFKCQQI